MYAIINVYNYHGNTGSVHLEQKEWETLLNGLLEAIRVREEMEEPDIQLELVELRRIYERLSLTV